MHKYTYTSLPLTKSFEGCKLTPYKCPAGIWTDGYGNTNNVIPGVKITQQKADLDLTKHISTFSNLANLYITYPNLTQNQFDACVDLMFNIGQNAFYKSTLLKKLNAGDLLGASAEFIKWNKVKGKEVDGLTRRRIAERTLFNIK